MRGRTIARALGEGALVIAVGEHQAPALAHDNRRASVLAHGQHAAGGDIGVLQEVVGDELVVVGGLGVVEYLAELFQVRGPQQVIDVFEGGLGQGAQRLVLDHEHVLAHGLFHPYTADIELAVRRLIRPEREQGPVVIGRDGGRGDGGVHLTQPFARRAGTL